MSPEIVEDHVHWSLFNHAFEGIGQLLLGLIEGNDDIRPECGEFIDIVLFATRHDHSTGAKIFADLNRKSACCPGRTVDKDGFASNKFRTFGKGGPG
jgi:hypothetical protein